MDSCAELSSGRMERVKISWVQGGMRLEVNILKENEA